MKCDISVKISLSALLIGVCQLISGVVMAVTMKYHRQWRRTMAMAAIMK
jgi:hypothetical protein